MSTPAGYSQKSSVVSSNISVINLPITNTSLGGLNIATIEANNGYIDIFIHALVGPNSSITIKKPEGTPVVYKGVVNKMIHLGADPSNTFPFFGKQNVTIILNAPPDESILVNQIMYKTSTPINYKKCATIFLTVYFILNVFL